MLEIFLFQDLHPNQDMWEWREVIKDFTRLGKQDHCVNFIYNITFNLHKAIQPISKFEHKTWIG